MELRQCGRWDVSVYLVVKNVGMLSIAEEKKKINAATLKQFFGVKHKHISIYCRVVRGSPKGNPVP